MGLAACAEPAVDACQQQCAKRAECGADIDVDQCRVACEGSVIAGSDECVDADLALQRCQVALQCPDYLGGNGCSPEAQRAADACD